MAIFNINLNRRDFIKKMAFSSAALMYGCSKDSPTYPYKPPGSDSDVTKAQIALCKTSDRNYGVSKVMELLEYPSMQDKHVIIKPNFNTADPSPASTHNDTLRQIITEAKNRNASGITLAERSFQVFDEVIEQKGIDSMADEMDFSITNLENDSYTTFTRDNFHWANGFRVPDTITHAEYIITTCCLKTHHTGVITMSLKLGVGILPRIHMTELHGSSDVNSMIAEINKAYKPDLIIMDGVTAFISGGPSQGVTAEGNVIIAGTDRIAVDAVGVAILKDLGSTRVMGDIFEVEQIRRAVELNLGITKPSRIEFITDDSQSQAYAAELTEILLS